MKKMSNCIINAENAFNYVSGQHSKFISSKINMRYESIVLMYQKLLEVLYKDFNNFFSNNNDIISLCEVVQKMQDAGKYVTCRWRDDFERVQAKNTTIIVECFDKIQKRLDSEMLEIMGRFGCESSYQNIIYSLQVLISKNQTLVSMFKDCKLKPGDNSWKISYLQILVEKMDLLFKRICATKYSLMIKENEYGKIDEKLFSQAAMSNNLADEALIKYERAFGESFDLDNMDMLLKTQPKDLAAYVWHYALRKPFSLEHFKRICNIHNKFYKDHLCLDVFAAELYYMKQMGGDKVIRDKISALLGERYDNCNIPSEVTSFSSVKICRTSEVLTLIASALMWIGAYDSEKSILEYMLSKNLTMSEKLQERLHSLNNGGSDAPKGYNISSSDEKLYFDVSSLTWNEEHYKGLFENLAFEEKILSYSIALRDEEKELLISKRIELPEWEKVLDKLKNCLEKDYGEDVYARIYSCMVLSGISEEKLKGILVQSFECLQLGILVHMACIGKKIAIKFYTLFMPEAKNLTEQKQQLFTLYKKTSPNVDLWEKSLKDTILLAFQQLLNELLWSNNEFISGSESIEF